MKTGCSGTRTEGSASVRNVMALMVLALSLMLALPAHADWYREVDKQSAWQGDLRARVAAIEEVFGGTLGLYVYDIDDGEAFSWRADDPWYLASLVKVPIAAEVFAERDRGELSLDDRLVLRDEDFVDGAGPTIWHDPGTPISINYLLEQMITVSDNTASDMLIHRVGLEAVNRRAQALVAAGGGDASTLGPITRLVGVRQGVYAQMHPEARALTGRDFIALRQHRVADRPGALARRLGVSPSSFDVPDYDSAFDAYEANGENSAPLRTYGDLLAGLRQEARFAPVLSLMQHTTSGEGRLKAGLALSAGAARFAHKTGTQHRRTCDAGIVTRGTAESARDVVVVACSRGPVARGPHENALARVGEALRRSGALGEPW